MSTWTDPDTGATIESSRVRRVTETARLRENETLGEIYLSDLRHLVERTAHIPGHAVVTAREGEIEVNYAVGEDLGTEEVQA